jgi:hypothetical protein
MQFYPFLTQVARWVPPFENSGAMWKTIEKSEEIALNI